MIKVNLDKAKEIHKENLRLARSQEFKSLDIEFMRAVETGDSEKIAETSAKKQELRDITTAEEIVSASSVDELKSHWPDVLSMSNPYEVQQ
jgi:predicted phosphoribosyltransferase